ncbi:MAG: AbrB/MazE/SpoVT family DNA-binding domain-containing protein [Clostridiales bacterium]|nr:AbrB/MazE/SpoVT family DNA-binding domain-containing protein [Clostridiales bacterium]
MKATGMVKQIDEMGRIVIPREIKRNMGIEDRDHLEIFVESDKIILKKYQPGCIFCGNTEDIHSFKGKLLCSDCKKQLLSID